MRTITSDELNQKLNELSGRGTVRIIVTVRDLEKVDKKYSLSFFSKKETETVTGFHGEVIPNAPKKMNVTGNDFLDLIDKALES